MLDFIGQQHRSFRFDLKYRALSGASRREVAEAVEEGFPYLPAGCHFELDRVARDGVLTKIREALPRRQKLLANELRDLGCEVGLGEFLNETLLELPDVYRGRGWTWMGLRRLAGRDTPPPGPNEEKLGRALGRMLHIDDPPRIEFYREIVSATTLPQFDDLSENQRRLLLMLHFDLRGVGEKWPSLRTSFDDLWRHPAIRNELVELLDVLDDRAEYLPRETALPLPGVLMVHARYSRDEILAAFDGLKVAKPMSLQTGVWYDKNTRTDVFLITLHKTEKHFSPTTRYEDYPISRNLFHWQSQSNTSTESPTGRRYLRQRRDETNVLLFVRMAQKDERRFAAPYLFLGPATYVRHEGGRPISITWRLKHEMPQDFFERAKVVAG